MRTAGQPRKSSLTSAILFGLTLVLVGAVLTGWLEAGVTRVLVARAAGDSPAGLALDAWSTSVVEELDLSSQPTLVLYLRSARDGDAQRVELDRTPIQVGRQAARTLLAGSLAAVLVALGARACRHPHPTPAAEPAPSAEPAPAARRALRQPPRAAPGQHGLTARELEVLRLMATSSTYREIANQLVVGEETVRTHAKNILHKLDQPDRRKAVLAAAALGLL
jgi:ATP/maltotriose-dependent transcriptional regulator MalT